MLSHQMQLNPFYSQKVTVQASTQTSVEMCHPTAFTALPKLERHQPDVPESTAVLSWACLLLLSCKSRDKAALLLFSGLSSAHPISWNLGADLRLGCKGTERCVM